MIPKFNSEFRLQNQSFSSKEEIIEFAKNINQELHLFLIDWFNNKSNIKVHTSGSTGKPKEILLEKKHLINSALATGTYFKVFDKTAALLCLPIQYIAGKMMVVRALTLGWHLTVIEPTSFPLQKINKSFDFAAMIPLQVENEINNLNKINTIIVGGAPISKTLKNKLRLVKSNLFETYGMTETCTHVAVKQINHFKNNDEQVFKALPNVKFKIDERKCLVIEAPNIISEKIITNDVVQLISDKEFTWKGRFDSVINSGGIKLFPEEIENKLTEIIKIPFFVCGIRDEKLGEKLVLIIEESNQNLKESLFSAILNNHHLTKFEKPKEIILVSEIIFTGNKKINRTETLKRIIEFP